MTDFFNVDTDPNVTLFPPVTYPNDPSPKQVYTWLRVLAGSDSVFAGDVAMKGDVSDRYNNVTLGGWNGMAMTSSDAQAGVVAIAASTSSQIVESNGYFPGGGVLNFAKPAVASTPNHSGLENGLTAVPDNSRVRVHLKLDVSVWTDGDLDVVIETPGKPYVGANRSLGITGTGIYEMSSEGFPLGGNGSGVLSVSLQNTSGANPISVKLEAISISVDAYTPFS